MVKKADQIDVKDDVKDDDQIEEKSYDLSKVSDQIGMFRDKLGEGDIQVRIAEHLKKILTDFGVENYQVVFLFDEHKSIAGFHSDKIYKSISDLDNRKDILMFVESAGGKIEPAYLISKCCKRLSKSKFNVAIARRAKSAATLVSLGATEVHMGLLSELGPIDPQFGGFPALGLANALEKIAQMTEQFPTASDMLAKYLTDNLNIRDLGYFERINESATQYALRLLNGKDLPEGKTCEDLADHFTNHYKDHSFVIDSDEALELLGNEMVKVGTKEYLASNAIYEFLQFMDLLFGLFMKKNMRYVGSVDTGLDLFDVET